MVSKTKNSLEWNESHIGLPTPSSLFLQAQCLSVSRWCAPTSRTCWTGSSTWPDRSSTQQPQHPATNHSLFPATRSETPQLMSALFCLLHQLNDDVWFHHRKANKPKANKLHRWLVFCRQGLFWQDKQLTIDGNKLFAVFFTCTSFCFICLSLTLSHRCTPFLIPCARGLQLSPLW